MTVPMPSWRWKPPLRDGLVQVHLRVVARSPRPAWATHIAFGEEVGAELHVVLEVKRHNGLEPCPVGQHGLGLGELLHTPDTAELLLRVLRDGQPGCSPIPAAVVAVTDRRCRSGRWVLLVGVEVVVGSHYDWRWWREPSGCREENVGGALYEGATVVLDLGFRNDNNETWRGEGIFPKGWCWREEGDRGELEYLRARLVSEQKVVESAGSCGRGRVVGWSDR